MRIVVTGASGFLGSWICRLLVEQGNVTALVRPSTDLRNLSGIPSLKIERARIESWPEHLRFLCPDVLILNDWWGVGNEYRNDPRQFENVERLRRIATSVLDHGVKMIVGVGSQAELGPMNTIIGESDPDNATTRYGEAKIQVRQLISELVKDSDIRFAWMRIFSTYGPLDQGTWLIPSMVDSLVNNREMDLTKGEQEWSYLHAYDLASAFRTAIREPTLKGIINVGNPQTISVYEVASIIGNLLEKRELLRFGALEYRSDQVMRLEPLCETLTSAGWFPQISFNEGIRQTIDWLQRKPLKSLKTMDGTTLNFNLPSRF